MKSKKQLLLFFICQYFCWQ